MNKTVEELETTEEFRDEILSRKILPHWICKGTNLNVTAVRKILSLETKVLRASTKELLKQFLRNNDEDIIMNKGNVKLIKRVLKNSDSMKMKKLKEEMLNILGKY
jgi:hypothetical protein